MENGIENPILKIDICPEGAENLVEAIVKTAAQDYRDALKRLKRNPSNKMLHAAKEVVERFFKSDYFRSLVPENLSGEYILRRLQEECL